MEREGERGNVEMPRLMRCGFNAGKMKGLIILYNMGDPSSLLAFILNEVLLFVLVSFRSALSRVRVLIFA